jgi:hypothetical protein
MQHLALFVKSIVKDKRLVFYGLILLALHVSGILLLYRLFSEFDNLPHFWFGFVLSEYSSRGSASLKLQSNLSEKFQKHGWTTASFEKVDFLVRLAGFLLVGGLFWEWAELFFSPFLGIKPDSFFAFPITLHNIDGALDVTMGIIGATLAFLIDTKRKQK